MKTSRFSISIIIPAYNVEKYIRETLTSVQNQEVKPDELIVIDDGSEDLTFEISNSFKFPFKYIVKSTSNNGQGHARNLGISMASSSYVYFLDSDDLIPSHFVATLKEAAEREKNPDIIFFSGESFNDGDYSGGRWVDYRRRFSGSFKNVEPFLDEAQFNGALFCSPCLYLSRRSLWGGNGLNFSSKYLEDQAIFFPLIFSCNSIVVLDDILFSRRNRAGSTMTMALNEKHVLGSLDAVEATLALQREGNLSGRGRYHVKQRVKMLSSSYLNRARLTGMKIEFLKIFTAAYQIKSGSLAAKAILYLLRLGSLRSILKYRFKKQ